MTEYKVYPLKSALAPYINDYIAEKRALGFKYNDKGYQLHRLDKYWSDQGYDDPHLTIERLNGWLCAYPGESKGNHGSRISAAKGLAIYLNIHGIKSEIPMLTVGKDHPIIHLMRHSELLEFFDVVDSYKPLSINASDFRMAEEYPIIFRMLYCCGMRNNEACSLRLTDVDMKEGIVTVSGGKNNKDRLVYLPEDLRILLEKYCTYLRHQLGNEPLWLFPGRYPGKHIKNSSLDRRFKAFWQMTKSSEHCDKTPTPHSLRHGFVVDRLNGWALKGVDINNMFIYLSKYLGHRDPDESFYYYHLVNDAYRIVRQKDRVSAEVIPEVRRL